MVPHRVTALLAALPIALAGPGSASGQSYDLDDWMTISSVGSFTWSPDGRWLYYTSDAGPGGTDEIFRVPAEGGEPVRLGQQAEGVRPEPVQELTLSPDGETLYYTAARYFQAYTNLYRMPASGGPAEALTFDDATIQTGPAPSPDGRHLAFYARTGRGVKIYLMDLEEEVTWPRPLFPGEGEETSPVWGPDGSLLVRRGGMLQVVDRPGADPTPLVEEAYRGGNGGPVWSPDATRIAVTRGENGFSQIGVVEVATGRMTPLTHAPREHGDPAWSPDGRFLAVVRSDAGGMSDDLLVVAADGSGEVRTLTEGKGQRSSPAFSPDGSRIAFLESTSTRTRDLWSVAPDGSGLRQITRSMGRVDPARLRAAEEVSWRAEDNLEIPAMLWRPPDFDSARRYPVLVRLHGHPGQWNHGFRMMTQYFVQR
ncbi:MAG TPA: hypothetical protein VLL48_13005, partial [Longimicrobiales bacterium]|nr:hypothetical protein [Longimicrobiales bacterium]